MNTIRADLHIHSCLSPCGSLEMSPSRIVQEALKQKLDLIAVTDHNTALNLPTLDRLCQKIGLNCLYGMEITTSEEIHLLAYFTDIGAALEFNSFIYAHLPNTLNQPDISGDQVVVDEDENIIDEVEKYLGNASDFNLTTLINAIHDAQGYCVPAHITHPHFSLVSQLGWVPTEQYDALELSAYYFLNKPDTKLPTTYPFITGSDAHYPEDIGRNYTEIIITDTQNPILPWTHVHQLSVLGKTVNI